jgi:hypothetical protein
MANLGDISYVAPTRWEPDAQGVGMRGWLRNGDMVMMSEAQKPRSYLSKREPPRLESVLARAGASEKTGWILSGQSWILMRISGVYFLGWLAIIWSLILL